MNVAIVLVAGVGCVAWLAIYHGRALTGATASGRGGLISIEIPVFIVLSALVIANLAWVAFVVRKG